MSDASLGKRIDANVAKRDAYHRVKNAISAAGLNADLDLLDYENIVKLSAEAIEKAGHEGYEYIAVLPERLSEDKQVMDEYLNFVKQANSYFKKLYKVLEEKISSLNSAITKDREVYNKGKLAPWDWK